jgi:hypothetical protein
LEYEAAMFERGIRMPLYRYYSHLDRNIWISYFMYLVKGIDVPSPRVEKEFNRIFMHARTGEIPSIYSSTARGVDYLERLDQRDLYLHRSQKSPAPPGFTPREMMAFLLVSALPRTQELSAYIAPICARGETPILRANLYSIGNLPMRLVSRHHLTGFSLVNFIVDDGDVLPFYTRLSFKGFTGPVDETEWRVYEWRMPRTISEWLKDCSE